MAFDARLALKLFTHNDDLEMRFRPRRHIMHVAFIDDIQMGRNQRGLELFGYGLLYDHDSPSDKIFTANKALASNERR